MKAGLLKFYISLYSKKLLERLQPFCDEISQMLEEKGIEIMQSDFCMEKPDFEKAIADFENAGCDVIITLHTAYSPSLESIDALAGTNLPIIVCDTTDTLDFSSEGSPSDISYCHGIHGVMDMCNMLRKNNKHYAIAAGHYKESNVIDKVAGFVRAAVCAKSVCGSKVGSIGGAFDGMGDFRVDDIKMKERFGATVVYPGNGELEAITESITDDEIKAEKEKNKADFEAMHEINEDIYTQSVKADITLRKWIEKNNLRALTVNFRQIGSLPTMPFNGACRAMENQIGYAGEGDTLTALFTGALIKEYKETSFVEIFCPDWKNNTLFISHMGEMNYRVADRKPELFEKDFIYGKENTTNPYTASAAFKEGEGVFVNIFEDTEGFNTFIAPVKVVKETTDNFVKNVRGWLDFGMSAPEALERMSMAGVTHHSILVYGARVSEIEFFAKLLEMKVIKM